MSDPGADTVLIADPEPIAHARRRLSAGDPRAASSKTHAPHDAAGAPPPDPDTCRICRGEATPEEPLFYPCKCSGSIKHVHQDCLMEWLSHSQKKHCELCKTPFRFTKLYSPNMPKTLPFYVFVSHVAKYLFRNILVWVRAALVVSVWLGWLPYLMRSVWSFLFWISDEGLGASPGIFARNSASQNDQATVASLGTTVCPSSPLFAATTTVASVGGVVNHIQLDSMVKSLYGNLTLSDPLSATILRLLFGSASSAEKAGLPATNTSLEAGHIPTSTGPSTLLGEVGFLRTLTRHPTLNRTIITVLEGQIITILVIVCFILIILVRDYVVQQQPEINMRAAFAAAEDAAPAAAEPVQDPPQAEDLNHARGADGAAVDARTGNHREEETVNNDNTTTTEELLLPSHDGPGDGETGGTDPAPSPGRTRTAPYPDWYPPWEADQGSQQGALATPRPESLLDSGDRSTVHEYLRVYREADGDPDKILEIARDEHLEDRLQYWLRLTQQVVERNKQSDKDNADGEESGSVAEMSTRADYAPSSPEKYADWDWPEDLRPTEDDGADSSSKGKDKADPAEDLPVFMGLPLRPRANTDGPSRHEGLNPLANNNWSFPGSSSFPDAELTGGTPDRAHADTTSADDLDVASGSVAWDYPTPPSSSAFGSASLPATLSESTEASGQDSMIPPAVSDQQQFDATEGNRPASAEWNSLPDFNQIPTPVVNGEPADAETQRVHRRPAGILEYLAEFMWRDVDLLDVADLQALAPGPDAFLDDDGVQPGGGGPDGDAEDFMRDREVVEAAVAAGLDPEAIEDAEDLEGVMELLGMRGPIAGLFQNAIFCAFLVSITIFLGIFMPYNFGRISVWIMANPMRPVRIVFSLSKFLQDVAAVALGTASSAIFYTLSLGAQLWERIVGSGPAGAYLASAVLTSWNMSASAAVRIVDSFLVEAPIISSGEIRNFSAISHEALLAMKGHVALAIGAVGQAVSFVLGGDYAAKGSHTLVFLSSVGTAAWRIAKEAPAALSNPGSWVISLDSFDVASPVNPELAHWDGMDRFWAIMVGYVALCLIAALYLRRGTPFSSGQTGQEWEASIIDGLNQASGVMKVILIIGIEMLIFPLYCGLLLDVALLPLFENTTLKSRLYFTIHYPLTSIFVHWFVGTGYMFHFALFVSMCRKIMRKGVLYFIRDPDDPEFHPVRDVLERNVTTQLRKILFSAFVYGALVVVCLGGVVWGLSLTVSDVLPIHYSSNEPVLEFPIDLLFYNFLMPLAIKFFKPSDGLHTMYTWWFRKCARALRVTWFLFGERELDEEGVLVLPPDSPYHKLPWWRRLFLEYHDGKVIPKTWNDAFEGGTDKPRAVIPPGEMYELSREKQHMVESKQLLPNGRFVRAPASDQVKIPKGKRVFREVSESNIRVRGQPQPPWLELNNSYATDQYQVVYVPPHFRFRVFLFIMFIWMFAAVTGVGFTILPLVFGRRMFKLLIPAHIRTNDIYAFSIGIYILGSLAYFIFHARPIYAKVADTARQTISTLSNHDAVLNAAALGFRGAKLVYSYFFLLVVFPLLASSLVELYLLIPLHTYMYPMLLPPNTGSNIDGPRHTVRVIQTWTLGLLYLKLAARTVTSWYDDTRLSIAVQAVLRRGWTDPDVRILTRAFVIPGLVLGFAAIVQPLLAAQTFIAYGGGEVLTPAELTLVYRLSYPITAFAVGVAWMFWGMVDIFRSWKVRIRDEAYLIGERLHNFGVGTGPRARKAWRAGGTRL